MTSQARRNAEKLKQVNTYAALTAIVASLRFDDMVVYVTSRTTEGDGGEGWWRFDAGSSATANGGTILAPNAGSGRWIRQTTNPVYLAWFGTTLAGVNAAIAYANATNELREIIFPAGTFTYAAAFDEITGNNVVLTGQGDFNGGTTLNFTTTSTDDIKISGAHSGIQNFYFNTTAKKTAGFSLVLTGFRSFAKDVRMDYVFNGISVAGGSTETRLAGNIMFRYLTGTRGVLFSGTNSARCYRLTIDNIIADNPTPLAHPSPDRATTWASSTSYVLNSMVEANNSVWQCTTAGTSAASGSGPSGVPGTGGASAFSTTVSDGTVQWRFVFKRDLKWLVQDSYAYSLVCSAAALINGANGFTMDDSANTGNSYPNFAFFWDLECDHSWSDCIQLNSGESFAATNPWCSSSMRGSGIVFGTDFVGEITIQGHRIFGNAINGILHNAGPVNVTVSDGFVGDNSVLTNDTYDGVAISANASFFRYQGNFLGDSPSVAGNKQRYSLLVNAGTSNHYIIADNIVAGSTTGGVSDGGSGVDKRVADNV